MSSQLLAQPGCRSLHEPFPELANQRLKEAGLVDWKLAVFSSSQLGNDQELSQKLKLGTVALALPSTVMVTDAFGLEAPYLVKNRAHMKRIEQVIFWPQLTPAAAAKGYRILAVWENGFRHIATMSGRSWCAEISRV